MAAITYRDEEQLEKYLIKITGQAAALYIKIDKRGRFKGGGAAGLKLLPIPWPGI